MEYAAAKAFFTGGDDRLLYGRMYRLVESEEFTPRLVRQLINSFTVTGSIARFAKTQMERSVSSERSLNKEDV